MTTIHHINRLALTLSAAIAAILMATAPTAFGARTATPDVFERFAAAHPYGLGTAAAVLRAPQRGDAAKTLPDVFERYAAAHRYGDGTPIADLRSSNTAPATPDVFERFVAHRLTDGTPIADLRSWVGRQ
jgi:hypothetical protein